MCGDRDAHLRSIAKAPAGDGSSLLDDDDKYKMWRSASIGRGWAFEKSREDIVVRGKGWLFLKRVVDDDNDDENKLVWPTWAVDEL